MLLLIVNSIIYSWYPSIGDLGIYRKNLSFDSIFCPKIGYIPLFSMKLYLCRKNPRLDSIKYSFLESNSPKISYRPKMSFCKPVNTDFYKKLESKSGFFLYRPNTSSTTSRYISLWIAVTSIISIFVHPYNRNQNFSHNQPVSFYH